MSMLLGRMNKILKLTKGVCVHFLYSRKVKENHCPEVNKLGKFNQIMGVYDCVAFINCCGLTSEINERKKNVSN